MFNSTSRAWQRVKIPAEEDPFLPLALLFVKWQCMTWVVLLVVTWQ